VRRVAGASHRSRPRMDPAARPHATAARLRWGGDGVPNRMAVGSQVGLGWPIQQVDPVPQQRQAVPFQIRDIDVEQESQRLRRSGQQHLGAFDHTALFRCFACKLAHAETSLWVANSARIDALC
jgi:hypothetical protein